MFILSLMKDIPVDTTKTEEEQKAQREAFIAENNLRKKFAEALEARKKIRLETVSKDDPTPMVRAEIDNISQMINFINTLDSERESLPDGSRIDDLMIPVEFKDFILPRSVRFVSGNRVFADLLDREKESAYEFYNVNWNSALSNYKLSLLKLRSITKETEVDRMVTVGSMRVDKSLHDVIDIAYTADEAGYNDVEIEGKPDGCVPLRLKAGIVDLDALYRMNKRYISGYEALELYISNLPR